MKTNKLVATRKCFSRITFDPPVIHKTFTTVIVYKEVQQKMNITCIKSTRAISTIIYYSALIGIRIVGEKYCEGFYFVLVERKKGHLNEFLFDF